MTVNCPTFTKKIKPCFVCGSLEHGAKQCTKGQDCFICKESGHRAKDCPQKYKGTPQSSKICLKCGGSGHEMFSCMNDYSVDDLKEIQCYICKSFGHLCCFTLGNDGLRQVSCYRCGELGHTGLECRRLHEEASMTESPSSCYRCGEGGHFARECTSSAKGGKRNHALSIPTLKAHRENKESLEMKSAPRDLGKAPKKRKTKSKEKGHYNPTKIKTQRSPHCRASTKLIPVNTKEIKRWMDYG
ncbi:hypothetical protein OIU77_029265 [Salix suchowensis]|uniref:CCHC-type domain-containing protein n=1 Tax=Salix suchowensis TaxID=1278906 RepID=A0ABQ9BN10_9ROSI|nr:hypothetical protein OIU77_029265 [Salix suchowensis]